MKLTELYQVIDSAAPFSLSAEMISRYGAYDNSGILLDFGGEIEKILFSLDLSKAAALEAIKEGAGCIVTHHPAIYAPLKKIEGDSAAGMCARAGISVISAHLNLDAAPGGIDESLMEALGGKRAEDIMQPLSKGGYGRIFGVPFRSMEDFLSHIRRTLHADRISSYGNANVGRVASFCGGGFDAEALAFAEEKGADTIVSSEGRHHLITAAAEKGINLVLLTHAASEEYGFYRFYQRIVGKLGIPCAYYAEKRFL